MTKVLHANFVSNNVNWRIISVFNKYKKVNANSHAWFDY